MMCLNLNFSMIVLYNQEYIWRWEWRGEDLLSIEKLLEHSSVQD